jgi:acyl-CoA thioesterase II
MNDTAAPWDPQDLAALLGLERLSPWRYQNRYHDPNPSGRSYGGQVMGQALMAAGQTVPDERRASAMQLLFLQGTRTDRPIVYEVEPLQDGKRIASRHVRGVQRGLPSLDAHFSFQTGLTGPSHAARPPKDVPAPEQLPRLRDLQPEVVTSLLQIGYSVDEKLCVDFRLVLPEMNPAGSASSLSTRYWMRSSRQLPDVPHLQEAALAFLSDWWTNFASAAPHIGSPEIEHGQFIVSLNHSLWIHRAPQVHDWMLVISHSPVADHGRGWSISHIYDQSGDMIATAAQECLMTPGHQQS